MKKLILSTLTVVCAMYNANAQDTLTGPRCNPVINETYVAVNCDTTGFPTLATTLANTGANHTWNYSSLTTISTDTAKAMACSSTAHCSLFLSSTNMAEVTLSNSAAQYSIINNDSVAQTGNYFSSTQNVILANPMVTLRYPFTYLDSFSDFYSGTVTYMPTGSSIPITAHQEGTLHVKADGWGILRRPGGVNDTNVLRVVGSQVFTDSATILTTTIGLSFNLTTVQWFKRDVHSPLMSITYIDQISGPGSTHMIDVSYAKRIPLGTVNQTYQQPEFAVYPNPAQSMLHFNVQNISGEFEISVCDVAGRIIASQTNDQSFDCSQLNKGIYMVVFKTGTTTTTQKVVIE